MEQGDETDGIVDRHHEPCVRLCSPRESAWNSAEANACPASEHDGLGETQSEHARRGTVREPLPWSNVDTHRRDSEVTYEREPRHSGCLISSISNPRPTIRKACVERRVQTPSPGALEHM